MVKGHEIFYEGIVGSRYGYMKELQQTFIKNEQDLTSILFTEQEEQYKEEIYGMLSPGNKLKDKYVEDIQKFIPEDGETLDVAETSYNK